MDAALRADILHQARIAHGHTEAAYQAHPAKRGDAAWEAKQRILLADMALHLLQTALAEGDLAREDLRRNLFSILTISELFLPGHPLKAVAEGLYDRPEA